MAVAAVAFTIVFASAPAPAPAASTTINLVASNWKFTPGTIIVHVHQATTLRLTSASGVHGIASPELGIANTVIQPGKFATVTFTPKKKGTYVIHCSVFCGPGHANMKFIIHVV
ncbi:MAG TPA: cupredoxin domain-containing protein [Candidatus Rubrimentiphilum sp.]|nr:cupredoxin domain-containing protein [Candidatus Rubrimentiphilum sp.]